MENTLGTFTINSLTNGWFSKGADFEIHFWKGLDSDRRLIFATTSPGPRYTLEIIGIDMTFKPTQSFQDYTASAPNIQYSYFLRNYVNTVEVQITGLWRNADIKQFWITKPPNVEYFDHTYCNSSLIIPQADRLPYPLRLRCQAYTDKISIDLTSETVNIPGYQAPYNGYPINLYLKAFVRIDMMLPTSGDFMAYGLVVPNGAFNLDKGVTQVQKSFTMKNYDLPDLSGLSFYTLSFYDRKARIGDKVELYMLLQPIQSPTVKKINSLIFRIPDEFSYPSIQNLDDCQIIGNINTDVKQCKLDRVDA